MFTSKNVTDLSDQNKKDTILRLQDVPVHTLKKDLDDIAHNRFSAKDYTTENRGGSETISSGKKSLPEKNSPFLNPQESKPPVEMKQEPKAPVPENLPFHPSKNFPGSQPASSQIQPVKPGLPISSIATIATPHTPSTGSTFNVQKSLPKATSGPRIRHTFAWGISIFIILAIGVSAYYFIFANPSIPYLSSNKTQSIQTESPAASEPVTKTELVSNTEPTNETSPSNLLPTPDIQEPSKVNDVAPISENVKTVSINSATATVSDIKAKLQEIADTMINSQVTSPVEVIFKDSVSGQNVDFPTFASRFQLVIPSSLNNQLEGSYKVFIYIDKGIPRIGLTLKVKEQLATKNAMSSEEGNLIRDFKNLFWISNYQDNVNAFSTGNYNGREVRYKNLNSPEELSLDYSVFNNQLGIGTTKMTLRSIVDYLDSKSGTGQ